MNEHRITAKQLHFCFSLYITNLIINSHHEADHRQVLPIQVMLLEILLVKLEFGVCLVGEIC